MSFQKKCYFSYYSCTETKIRFASSSAIIEQKYASRTTTTRATNSQDDVEVDDKDQVDDNIEDDPEYEGMVPTNVLGGFLVILRETRTVI